MLNTVRRLLRHKHGCSQFRRGLSRYHPINEDVFGLSESQQQVIFFSVLSFFITENEVITRGAVLDLKTYQ